MDFGIVPKDRIHVLHGAGVNLEDYEARLQEFLMQQMERFINLPYEEKRKMGKKSHVYVAQHFDKRKVVQETVEVLYHI